MEESELIHRKVAAIEMQAALKNQVIVCFVALLWFIVIGASNGTIKFVVTIVGVGIVLPMMIKAWNFMKYLEKKYSLAPNFKAPKK